jgi:hypothetical protein
MKIPKTSSRRRSSVVVSGALLAATAIVTVLGMTVVVVPASSIFKPVYAQIAQDINQEVEAENIPDLALGGNAEQGTLQLDFGQNVEEVVEEDVEEETTGQPLPVMP